FRERRRAAHVRRERLRRGEHAHHVQVVVRALAAVAHFGVRRAVVRREKRLAVVAARSEREAHDREPPRAHRTRTTRMTLLPVSAMYSLPFAYEMPNGRLRCAAVAGPLSPV